MFLLLTIFELIFLTLLKKKSETKYLSINEWDSHKILHSNISRTRLENVCLYVLALPTMHTYIHLCVCASFDLSVHIRTRLIVKDANT